MGQLVAKVRSAFECKCLGSDESKLLASYITPYFHEHLQDDGTSSLDWDSEREEFSEDEYADESDFASSSTECDKEFPEPRPRILSKRERIWQARHRVDLQRRMRERKGRLMIQMLIRDRKKYELSCYHRLAAGMAPHHPLVFQRFDTHQYNEAVCIRHSIVDVNGGRQELIVFMTNTSVDDLPSSLIPLISKEGQAYKYDLTYASATIASPMMIVRCGEYIPVIRYDGPFVTLLPTQNPHVMLTITDTRQGPYFRDALRGEWHPNIADRCPFKLRCGHNGNWCISFKRVSSFSRNKPWRRHN